MSIEQESVLDIKRISDTMCVLDMKHVFNSSTTSVPNIFRYVNTGCPRRNVRDFGRVFLMLNYTDITQNTYIQS